MERKLGLRRELLVVGGILFLAMITVVWFFANLFFDRWGIGGFSPFPFLPYPTVAGAPSYNSAHWIGFFYLYLLIGLPLFLGTTGELFYIILKGRSHNSRTDTDPSEKILPGTLPARRGKPRTLLYLNLFVAIILFALTAYSLPLNGMLLGPPPNSSKSLTIEVYAFQWGWKFVYPDNHSSVGSAILPVGEEIVFTVTSTDVMHDFAIPSLAVKTDAYPGHWNTAWTNISSVGNYTVFCMELCGIGHASMIATIHAVSAPQFVAWYLSTNEP